MNTPAKILVVQLARLGDIFQSQPTLHALKRSYPGAELHFLTRSKFAAAAPDSTVIDRHWTLDTREVLTPLIDEIPNIPMALEKLTQLTSELKEAGFDLIVNLSFSPFSSYLTREISTPLTDVRGYTRFSDGFLAIPDDSSAYFYAQVGPQKSNRIHLTDLFASVAGVELTEADWVAPKINEQAAASTPVQMTGEGCVVVHVGASDLAKTLDAPRWGRIVRRLLERTDRPVVLVGAQAERDIAQHICEIVDSPKLIDLVGKTDLSQLIEIVRKAHLVIGGDSAPVQVASLTATPVLNLSFPIVSHWETGPRSAGSRILVLTSPDLVSTENVVNEAIALLEGQSPVDGLTVAVSGPTQSHYRDSREQDDFGWELLKAIYMGHDFPPSPNELFSLGAQRLAEVNRLAREQIEVLRRETNATTAQGSQGSTAGAILQRVDEIIAQIQKFVPEVEPLVKWFETERLRMGPMPLRQIVETTDQLHAKLGEVLALYTANAEGLNSEGGSSDSFVVG